MSGREIISPIQSWYFLLLVLFGPLPLSLVLLERIELQLREPLSRSARWLLIGVFWSSINMSLGLFVGLIGLFTGAAIFLGELVIFATGIWLMWRCGLLNWAVWRGKLFFQPTVIEKLLLALLFGLLGVQAWLILSEPMTDFDTLMYHLPNIAQWHTTGTFTVLEQFQFTNSRFPFGWELLASVLTVPFQSDIAAGLVNLLAWVMWGLGVVAVTTLLGVNRIIALSVASLIMVTPIALGHLNTLHVELAFVAFFTAGLYLALSMAFNQNTVLLWPLLLTIGLLLGIKISGVLYGIPLVGIAFLAGAVVLFQGRARRDSALRLTPVALYCLGSAVFIGLFWYVKNWLAVGNPLGYLEVRIGSWLIFAGNRTLADYTRTSLWSIFDVTSRADWEILLTQIWHQFRYPLVAFFAGALLLPLSLRRQKRRQASGGAVQLLVLLSVTALTGLLYLRAPFTGDTLLGASNWQVSPWIGQAMRFAFPFVTMLAILAAYSIGSLDFPAWIVGVLTTLFMVAATIWYGSWVSLLLVVMCLAIWQLYTRFEHLVSLSGSRLSVGFALFVVVLTAAAFVFQEIGERREVARGELFNGITVFVDRELDTDRLAYMFNLRSYPLYGSDLKGDVTYVEGSQVESLEQLNAKLRELSISALAVGPIPERWRGSPQANWFVDYASLQPIFGRDVFTETVIFQLLP